MQRVQFMEPSPLLTDRARKAFQLANQEAQRLNHSFLGLEHLLLGLAKEGLSPAALTLKELGYELEWLCGQLERRRSIVTEDPLPGKLPYTSQLQTFLDDVLDVGRFVDLLPLTPERLLAALVEEPEGVVGDILGRKPLALWKLKKQLRRLSCSSVP